MIGNASIECSHADIEAAWTSLEGTTVKVTLSRDPLRRFDRSRQVPAPIGVS